MEWLMKKMDGNIYLFKENQKKEDTHMVTYVPTTLRKFKKC